MEGEDVRYKMCVETDVPQIRNDFDMKNLKMEGRVGEDLRVNGLVFHPSCLFELLKVILLYCFKLQLIFQRTTTVSSWWINFSELKESVMGPYLPSVTAPLLRPAPTPALPKLQNVRAVMWQSLWDS